MATSNIPLFNILEPKSPAPTGHALLRLGFRPFYLAAAGLAAVAVPVWIAVFLGYLAWLPSVSPLLWHAHEMLFGFATTVIIGFLMTAAKSWTGLATPRGPFLGALALLWLSARIAAVAAPYALYAVLDTLLLPVVAAVLTRLLLRAGNTRNLPLAGILIMLALVNAVFHLTVLGLLELPPVTILHAALALILMVECVMAGRVVPGFTQSAIPGLKIAPLLWLEWASLACTAMGLALWVIFPPGLATWVVLGLAAACHLGRQWRWHSVLTRHRPILWILHVSYAWIPVGLALLALSQVGLVPVSLGIHALAVGTTGGLIIGMITRTARAHTGRHLEVSGAEVLAYAMLPVAAVMRVFIPLFWPTLLPVALLGAALAWSAAFLIYVIIYTPWLARTRIDGRDG